MTELTIDSFMPTQKEVEGRIEARIIELFEQLPGDRQAVVLDALEELIQDDDGDEPSFHGDHFE